MQIDEFLELAKRRRSIRRFKPDPFPDEYIEKLHFALDYHCGDSQDEEDIKEELEEELDPKELEKALEKAIRNKKRRNPRLEGGI